MNACMKTGIPNLLKFIYYSLDDFEFFFRGADQTKDSYDLYFAINGS